MILSFLPIAMISKLFLTSSIILLISSLIAINHEFSYQPSFVEDFSRGRVQRREWEALQLNGATGPESFAFDPFGQGPYAGISDDRIVKWKEHERRWTNFFVTSQKRNMAVWTFLLDGRYDPLRERWQLWTIVALSLPLIPIGSFLLKGL